MVIGTKLIVQIMEVVGTWEAELYCKFIVKIRICNLRV